MLSVALIMMFPASPCPRVSELSTEPLLRETELALISILPALPCPSRSILVLKTVLLSRERESVVI